MDQLLDQIAHGEVCRVALATVAEFLAEAQRLGVGTVQWLERVPERRQRSCDQGVVSERQASEEDVVVSRSARVNACGFGSCQ